MSKIETSAFDSAFDIAPEGYIVKSIEVTYDFVHKYYDSVAAIGKIGVYDAEISSEEKEEIKNAFGALENSVNEMISSAGGDTKMPHRIRYADCMVDFFAKSGKAG